MGRRDVQSHEGAQEAAELFEHAILIWRESARELAAAVLRNDWSEAERIATAILETRRATLPH